MKTLYVEISKFNIKNSFKQKDFDIYYFIYSFIGGVDAEIALEVPRHQNSEILS